MKQNQMVHIGMLNSYNVLINNISMSDIALSGLNVFSHSQQEKDAKVSIEFMIKYFQDIEMYEKCSELQKYIDENFDEQGNFKEHCNCEYPDIKEYGAMPKCLICKGRL
jgi:hypothetical protein